MWDSLIISPFVNVLLFIYNVIGQNFGVAIILFTLLIRLLTHPLMVQQIKGATAMQDLQKDKRYLDLQKKYKDDKQQEWKNLSEVWSYVRDKEKFYHYVKDETERFLQEKE